MDVCISNVVIFFIVLVIVIAIVFYLVLNFVIYQVVWGTAKRYYNSTKILIGKYFDDKDFVGRFRQLIDNFRDRDTFQRLADEFRERYPDFVERMRSLKYSAQDIWDRFVRNVD